MQAQKDGFFIFSGGNIYKRPALTIDGQIAELQKRGLRIIDCHSAIDKLNNVNFYRLSLYFPPFQQPNTNKFIKGTTFENIWNRYVFDRQLRLLTLDLIERFEISLRTKIINLHSLKYNALGYTITACLPNMGSNSHASFLSQILQKQANSQDDFIKQHKRDYPDEVFLPFWKAGELMDFGNISRFYEGMDYKLSENISKYYGIHKKIFPNWIRSISYTRNLCAHHQRLWNRVLSIKPEIPREQLWQFPVKIGNEHYFGIITILRYLQKIIAPQSSWKKRFFDLFDKHPDIPKAKMGFPDNWQDSPIWKD